MAADDGPPHAGTDSARPKPDNPWAKQDTGVRMTSFPGRVGITQRVLPGHRAPFFDRLGTRCSEGLEVFAGEPRAQKGIAVPGAVTMNTADLDPAA